MEEPVTGPGETLAGGAAHDGRNVWILSFTLVVVMLGFGIVIPIFPFYIERMGAGGSELGLLVAFSSLMEFVFAPVWGSVSDRVGRKPILVIGMLGYALSMLFLGLSTELWMLFAARGLGGILTSAALPTSMAYIGDSTREEDRGGGMGMLGSAMGLGVILGPGIGGWIAGGSLSTPFYLSSGLSMVALLLIVVLLPESLPKERRLTGSTARTVQLVELWHALRSPIGLLLFMAFLLSFGLTNFEAIFGLYALEKFGYGPERVGVILMVIGIVSVVGKGVLTGPFTRRFGEAKVIKLSLLAGSGGFLILLLAETYLTILLATGFFILSKTLLRPAVLSLTSKRSSVGQGVAMGLSNSFMSLGRIAGPVWAGYSFDLNINYPYISGSFILFIGFLLSLVWGLDRRTARPRTD
jgi:DHA1 family multidrug resistance protein-like MFS transporter